MIQTPEQSLGEQKPSEPEPPEPAKNLLVRKSVSEENIKALLEKPQHSSEGELGKKFLFPSSKNF